MTMKRWMWGIFSQTHMRVSQTSAFIKLLFACLTMPRKRVPNCETTPNVCVFFPSWGHMMFHVLVPNVVPLLNDFFDGTSPSPTQLLSSTQARTSISNIGSCKTGRAGRIVSSRTSSVRSTWHSDGLPSPG